MRGLTLLCAAALAGCAAGPDYRREAPAPAPLAQAAASHFTATAFEARWWSQFGDALLDELVAAALDANRDLAVAAARLREAGALAGAAAAQRGPALDAGAGWTRSEGLPPADAEAWQLGLQTRWEIDLFGRQRRAAEAAGARADAVESDLHAAQVSVAAEVARAYFELRGAERRLEVAGLNRDKQRETLRLTEVRHDAGAGSELEVASARARLAAVEASVPQFEAAAQRLRHRLAVLSGRRPGELDARLAAAPRPHVARELPIGDAAAWLRRRPDLRAAERRLAEAVAGQGVAAAELYPRLTVAGFVGFFSGGHAGTLLDSGAQAWSAAPALSWTALDWGAARARLRGADARAAAALAAHEQAVLLAIEEAENALVGYARGRERLAHLAEQAAASARAAELARVRYREGAADFLVLLDAERTQLQAEDAMAEGETAVNAAAVAVYRALGGGWEAASATGGTVAGASSIRFHAPAYSRARGPLPWTRTSSGA